jgi:hypothetical protein
MTTTIADDPRTAIPTTPPPGWERETPKYRVIRDTKPAPKSRVRFEPPFASGSESDVWQYGERLMKAGEIVETTEWPHPMFFPLNYAAKKVLEFFNSRQKSRLPRSPFAGDVLRLDDGLGGPLPKLTALRPEPVDLQPVRF